MILPDPYPAATAAARKHAEIEWPNESVGFVIEGGEYVPLVNVHPDPGNHFAISQDDEVRYAAEKLAVIHSHCITAGSFHANDGPLGAGPSAHDMRQQIVSACPWGLIVVVDGLSQECVWWGSQLYEPPLSLPVPPLLKRPFIHGVYDCLSIILDAYRTDAYGFVSDYYGVDSIILPEYPREFGWWSDREDGRTVVPGDMYRDNFKACGFRQISQDEMRPGDVFLAQVLAPVTNHGGIYLGRGEILHHLRGRLSKTDVASRWLGTVTHYLRYDGVAKP